MLLEDISYADPCSYADYELGVWGVAYLLSQTNERFLLDDFYPMLNELGWEGAFVGSFGISSERFYTEFAEFLEYPIAEQLDNIERIKPV